MLPVPTLRRRCERERGYPVKENSTRARIRIDGEDLKPRANISSCSGRESGSAPVPLSIRILASPDKLVLGLNTFYPKQSSEAEDGSRSCSSSALSLVANLYRESHYSNGNLTLLCVIISDQATSHMQNPTFLDLYGTVKKSRLETLLLMKVDQLHLSRLLMLNSATGLGQNAMLS